MIRREQYERLARYLRADGRARIEVTFAEVAGVVGEQLPKSAYLHDAWWAKDPGHTQAVWLDVSYRARPDFVAGSVTFTSDPEVSP